MKAVPLMLSVSVAISTSNYLQNTQSCVGGQESRMACAQVCYLQELLTRHFQLLVSL